MQFAKSAVNWIKDRLSWNAPQPADGTRVDPATPVPAPPVPVIWLLGKTQSGKSSIIRLLTGADAAVIGNGFRPETRITQSYVFPSEDEPLLRFLDTRGLGEAGYSPAEEIAKIESQAHLLVVTARASDHSLGELLTRLKDIRARQPQRPVLLALTCLHETYGRTDHPQPDPFPADSAPINFENMVGTIPADLLRSLEEQRQRFGNLVDTIIPVDLTDPVEGYTPPDFGAERLRRAIGQALPAAYRQTFLQLKASLKTASDKRMLAAQPHILWHSSAASAAAASPIPWADIPVVLGIQTRMVYRLGDIYGQQVQTATLLKLVSAIGGQMAGRLAIRGLFKAVPVAGMALNAALAFASTYALGLAVCWYFGQVGTGRVPTKEELATQWAERLAMAEAIWAAREVPPTNSGSSSTGNPPRPN